MSETEHRHGRRRPRILVLLLCLTLLITAALLYLKKDTVNTPFSVLILGDSQMAGNGWSGGYANCIAEVYPNAQVVNLAQSGSLLSNGDILAQWEFYRTEASIMPDFVLLDGGINDLSLLRKTGFQEEGLALVRNSLCSIIEQIHEVSPDTHILYLVMPPFAEWKDTEEGLPSYDIQRLYWKQMHITANTYDYVTVVDLFTLNPFQYPSAASYRKHLADNIHLSEAGYRKTFEHFQNILTAHLETAG